VVLEPLLKPSSCNNRNRLRVHVCLRFQDLRRHSAGQSLRKQVPCVCRASLVSCLPLPWRRVPRAGAELPGWNREWMNAEVLVAVAEVSLGH
jgi:hypothetical protein